MKYLIDTNIVIAYLRGKITNVNKAKTLIKQGCGISAISLAELYHGAEKSSQTIANYQRIERFLKIPVVKEIFLDKQIAKIYGKLIKELEIKGMKLDSMDVLIAATAKANNLTILTEDKKHFGRLVKFGIKVEVI